MQIPVLTCAPGCIHSIVMGAHVNCNVIAAM